MAWNNTIVGTYGPTSVTPVMPVQPMAPQPQGSNLSILWVKSEEEARNFPVAPGSSVMLMNENESAMYLKSTDISGRPFPLETYDLVKREEKKNTEDYVKREELEQLVADAVSKAFANRPRKHNNKRSDDRRFQEGVNENG